MEEDELELIENIIEQGKNDKGEYCRLHCILEEEDLQAIEKLIKEYKEADEERTNLSYEYRKLKRKLDAKEK